MTRKKTSPPTPPISALVLFQALIPPPGVAAHQHRADRLLDFLNHRLRLGPAVTPASFLARTGPDRPASQAFAAFCARHAGAPLSAEDRLLLLASYADALAADPDADLTAYCERLLADAPDAGGEEDDEDDGPLPTINGHVLRSVFDCAYCHADPDNADCPVCVQLLAVCATCGAIEDELDDPCAFPAAGPTDTGGFRPPPPRPTTRPRGPR